MLNSPKEWKNGAKMGVVNNVCVNGGLIQLFVGSSQVYYWR
jgi:hypothetical protein